MDKLRAARGIIVGAILGIIMWIIIFASIALMMNGCLAGLWRIIDG